MESSREWLTSQEIVAATGESWPTIRAYAQRLGIRLPSRRVKSPTLRYPRRVVALYHLPSVLEIIRTVRARLEGGTTLAQIAREAREGLVAGLEQMAQLKFKRPSASEYASMLRRLFLAAVQRVENAEGIAREQALATLRFIIESTPLVAPSRWEWKRFVRTQGAIRKAIRGAGSAEALLRRSEEPSLESVREKLLERGVRLASDQPKTSLKGKAPSAERPQKARKGRR